MPADLGAQVLVGHEPSPAESMTVVAVPGTLLGDRALRRVNCTNACSSLRYRADTTTPSPNLTSGLLCSRYNTPNPSRIPGFELVAQLVDRASGAGPTHSPSRPLSPRQVHRAILTLDPGSR